MKLRDKAYKAWVAPASLQSPIQPRPLFHSSMPLLTPAPRLGLPQLSPYRWQVCGEECPRLQKDCAQLSPFSNVLTPHPSPTPGADHGTLPFASAAAITRCCHEVMFITLSAVYLSLYPQHIPAPDWKLLESRNSLVPRGNSRTCPLAGGILAAPEGTVSRAGARASRRLDARTSAVDGAAFSGPAGAGEGGGGG